MKGTYAIECKDLVKSFGSVNALDGLSLNIPSGKIFGILGPNGAGKTTFIRICKGILRPSSGEVSVCGLSLKSSRNKIKEMTGHLPESPALFETLTTWEYLILIGALYLQPRRIVHSRANMLLKAFDLLNRREDQLSTLSRGMRQRVMICATFLHNPSLVFLDEPFTSLDVRSSQTFKQLIQRLPSEERTVVICSHVIPVLEDICDEVAILDNGRLLHQATPSVLMRETESETLEDAYLTFLPEEEAYQDLDSLFREEEEEGF